MTVLFLAAEAFGHSRDGPVINHLGSDRRVVLTSGSFPLPLCRVDANVNRQDRRWVGIHDVRGQRNTDLG